MLILALKHSPPCLTDSLVELELVVGKVIEMGIATVSALLELVELVELVPALELELVLVLQVSVLVPVLVLVMVILVRI